LQTQIYQAATRMTLKRNGKGSVPKIREFLPFLFAHRKNGKYSNMFGEKH